MKTVVVSGSFDDLRSRHVRFLQEAARLGNVQVLLWSDKAIQADEGNPPKFSEAERCYLLKGLRFVHDVTLSDPLTELGAQQMLSVMHSGLWVVNEDNENNAQHAFCQSHGLVCHVVKNTALAGFPLSPPVLASNRKKVLVTGCYDWFHSGHVRFFEEVSQLGDVYVVVGSDANVRLLKGEGHPLFSQEERRYLVGAVRHVTQSLVSTGTGWMDAAPEIEKLKPDMYVVNEDGDKPEKRVFCRERGLEYIVLKRLPKDGLVKRSSTNLRGF
jgi:cytidyltransferase-like protein